MQDVQEAFRVLKMTIESNERSITHLRVREADQNQQIETLERRITLAEANADALRTERDRLADMGRELEGKVTSLKLRVEEAEHRAALYEENSDLAREKADRHDRIKPACEKLLDALGALPLDIADAALIPGAARPKIELYGTYDWQHVMDAKFALKNALGKKE